MPPMGRIEVDSVYQIRGYVPFLKNAWTKRIVKGNWPKDRRIPWRRKSTRAPAALNAGAERRFLIFGDIDSLLATWRAVEPTGRA
jgi:hypothetical protein